MADTLLQAVVAHVKGTDLVRGRVFHRDHVPQNPTMPYCVVDMVGDQNIVFSGDAQQLSFWQQMVQVSLFQEGPVKNVDGRIIDKYDQNLPGQLFRSFREMAKVVGNHRITVRLRSMNNIPQPEEELTKQDSMTIEITRTLEAI